LPGAITPSAIKTLTQCAMSPSAVQLLLNILPEIETEPNCYLLPLSVTQKAVALKPDAGSAAFVFKQ